MTFRDLLRDTIATLRISVNGGSDPTVLISPLLKALCACTWFPSSGSTYLQAGASRATCL